LRFKRRLLDSRGSEEAKAVESKVKEKRKREKRKRRSEKREERREKREKKVKKGKNGEIKKGKEWPLQVQIQHSTVFSNANALWHSIVQALGISLAPLLPWSKPYLNQGS
jgi:phage I-like protein